MIKEKTIDAQIKRRVEFAGGMYIKMETNHYSGLPDRLIILDKIYFAELKSENKKPTKLQLKIHDDLRKLGHNVFVINSQQSLQEFYNYAGV